MIRAKRLYTNNSKLYGGFIGNMIKYSVRENNTVRMIGSIGLINPISTIKSTSLTKSISFSKSGNSLKIARFNSTFTGDISDHATSNSESKSVMLHLANISEELGTKFEYPKVAVVGNQSSGKSSVLEAIIGLPIFPKGNNMVTRRPLELTMIRDTSMASGFKAQFGSMGRVITSIPDVHTELLARNAGDITEEPIYLTITSPHVHNLTVVDLPGFIRVTKAGEDEDLPDKIRDMCLKYVHNPTFIKLIVMAATNDRALSMGLEEVKKARQFHNAFGVLTKIDLVVKKAKSIKVLKDMLRDKDYLPGLGLVGVQLRSIEDVDEGKTLDDMISNESSFIEQHKLHEETDLNVSVPLLREVLSREQLKRIASSFPSIIDQIEQKVIEEQQNRGLLDQLAAQPDLTPISRKVKDLVTILHPLSPSRSDFEKELEEGLGELVKQETERSIANNIPLDRPKDMELELNMQANKGTGSSFEKSAFFNLARSSYSNINGNRIDKDKCDDFRFLTILGESDPQINNDELKAITESAYAANITVPFYRWVVPSDFQRRRVKWNGQLSFVIEDLLEINELADKSRKYCIDKILTFVESAAETKSSHTSDIDVNLAKGFFRYIISQITERTNKENLVESIKQMIAREKRPLADISKLSNGAHRTTNLPFDDYIGFFDTEHFPVFMNVYGNIWNHAYVHSVLIPRIQTDTFRIIAVNLLDPLILDAIEQSLKFFQHKDFDREQKEVVKKIARLNKHVEFLQNASLEYEPVSDYLKNIQEEREKAINEKKETRKRIKEIL